MNEIQAIRTNDERRQVAQYNQAIRQICRTQKRINQLYLDLLYCDECHERVLRRAPCEHLAGTLS